jgi:hypothetical protein
MKTSVNVQAAPTPKTNCLFIISDCGKRVLLSHLFDFFFGDFRYNVLNTVPTCRRNRNRKGEKEGHVSLNPLYQSIKRELLTVV